MYDMIEIIKLNELYVKLKCDRAIEYEISDRFSFFVPDHQFMPAFKHGDWDGKIRLYNTQKHTFPIGLIAALVKMAKENGWKLNFDRELLPISFDEDIEAFNSEVLPKLEMEPYDYQLDTFIRCIKNNRALVLSPTGSGKSYIIYLIVRFMLMHTEEKIIISVPSINLVKQMHSDFCAYEDDGFVCDQCYEMSANKPKVTDKRIVIATWAMLMNQKADFFSDYQTYICDECVEGDSEISMSDGTKKICEIQIGDLVKTLNEDSNYIELKPVLKVYKNLYHSSNEKRYKITMESGETLIATGNHKIMTSRGWVRVDKITKFDEILTDVC
jgi:hypothetical protein